MQKTFGLLILLGLAIGATFGVVLGEVVGNPLLGVGIGALAGVFLGWFAAAARSTDSQEGK